MPRTWQGIPFNPNTVLMRQDCRPLFTDRETEAQIGHGHPAGDQQIWNSTPGLPHPQMYPLASPGAATAGPCWGLGMKSLEGLMRAALSNPGKPVLPNRAWGAGN